MSDARPGPRRRTALVTGAGGFIGHHLVKRLKHEGSTVIAVSSRLPEFEPSAADRYERMDLRTAGDALRSLMEGVDDVYHLAADMGGIGYTHTHATRIFASNIRLDLTALEAAADARVRRFFYASSACVYPAALMADPDAPALREDQAYPAGPADAYGWEKLMAEQLCADFRRERGLQTRVARFHTTYGPLGTWSGGREKAPAAICRKVALASEGGDVEVWGDGRQTRTFCYVDDLLEGVRRLTESDFAGPVNLGSDRLISIEDLTRLVIGISGKRDLRIRHVEGPEGARGRVPDNALVRQALGWEPTTSLEQGMAVTYRWIAAQVEAARSPSSTRG